VRWLPDWVVLAFWAVEGIIRMSVGARDGFIAEQERSPLTTTPSTLAGWVITHLRPAHTRQHRD
jgi:hypothetical protein